MPAMLDGGRIPLTGRRPARTVTPWETRAGRFKNQRGREWSFKDMPAQKRRVPVCKINWCCPYRSDLCQSECSGARQPKVDFMMVIGDDVLIREPGAEAHTRYTIPKETRKVFRAFDSGDDLSFTDDQFYDFVAPKMKRHG
jgi:hypothetical protein